jgi:hypothetical protein
MRLLRARTFLAVLALAIAPACPAAAQGNDPAAATVLFQEGREAAKMGDYTTACRKMDESYRLDPAVGTLLNLADCQEHLGRLASAWQRFQEAVDKLPPADDRLAAVKQRVAALAARLPRLTVTLAPGAPPGTTVTRDGTVLGDASLGAALPVDPGAHFVAARAPGRDDRQIEVDVAEGRSERVVIEPGPPSPPPLPGPGTPRPVSRSGSGPLIAGGATLAGVGVLTLGVAVGTGLALPAKEKTVTAHCGANAGLPANRCDSTGFAAAQSGQTLATANTATWVAGGLATAAGAALVVVGLVRRGKPGAPVQVGLSVGPVGATLQGRFE